MIALVHDLNPQTQKYSTSLFHFLTTLEREIMQNINERPINGVMCSEYLVSGTKSLGVFSETYYLR